MRISSTILGGGGFPPTTGVGGAASAALGWYNAKDYGVVGNGIDADLAALDTLANNTIPAAGGVLYLPPGAYDVGGAPLVIPPHVHLYMAAGARFVHTSGGPVYAIEIQGDFTAPRRAHVFQHTNAAIFSRPLEVYREWFSGLTGGSPEGVINAPVGSSYVQPDGANGKALWVKRSGDGITGWARISTDLAIFNVRDFGAKGDSITDDSTAIQAAINAATAALEGGLFNVAGKVGGTGYTTPGIYFPKGRYKIGAALDPASVGMFFSHDKAVLIQNDPAQDIFFGETFRLVFRNLIFVRGRDAVSLTNNNVDTTQVRFENCEFHAQERFSVNARPNLVSATMTFEHCWFLRPAQVIHTYCDKTTFRDCWVYISKSNFAANTAAFLHARGELVLDNCQLVPTIAEGGARVVNARWIDAYGSVKCINGTRFGGEDAGMGIIWWFSAPAVAYPWHGDICVFRDCSIAAGASADPASGVLHLRGEIPQQFIFEGNSSLTEIPLVVTTAITLSTYLAALPANTKNNIRWSVPNNTQRFGGTGVPSEMLPYIRRDPTTPADIGASERITFSQGLTTATSMDVVSLDATGDAYNVIAFSETGGQDRLCSAICWREAGGTCRTKMYAIDAVGTMTIDVSGTMVRVNNNTGGTQQVRVHATRLNR